LCLVIHDINKWFYLSAEQKYNERVILPNPKYSPMHVASLAVSLSSALLPSQKEPIKD
jgi:hypothetical protein